MASVPLREIFPAAKYNSCYAQHEANAYGIRPIKGDIFRQLNTIHTTHGA